MKAIILFFTLFMYSCSASSQIQNSSDDTKISSAYNFVSKKYDGEIIVSDTIVKLDIVNFSGSLAKELAKKQGVILDSLTRVNNKIKYTKYKYPVKKLLKNKAEFGDYKFFFSRPERNYILVEVFETKNEDDLSYNELAFFGSSDVFLLYFDSKGQIIKDYRITLDYN